MRKKIIIGVLLTVVAVFVVIATWFPAGSATQGTSTADGSFEADMRGGQKGAIGSYRRVVMVENFCSTHHNLPPPSCEPKELWPAKIEEMYGYAQNERPLPPGDIPPIEIPTEYFLLRAPEFLEAPADAFGSPPSPLRFDRQMLSLEAIPGPPAISCVKFVRLRDDAPTQLLISDMRQGLVVLWTPSLPDQAATVVGRVAHPSQTHVVDLDGDGLRDILVANLGVFWPQDTTQGSVVWLRARGDGRFDNIVLLDQVSRVNDVRAADFDNDGDLDIVVAVFGNLTTGRIVYLENVTEDYSRPKFEAISLDEHTGTSDVAVVDLDRDGLLDFIALQSQESERIVAFLGVRGGNFMQETIYQAPHPRWGSTGIRLIDFDDDGDMDLLLNNGDSVQLPPIPRPYHGLGWLENQGDFPFIYHRLTHLPGAHTALPGDLDGDGDLDLVCSAFIPTFNTSWPNTETLDTIIWLERIAPGRYRRFSLETGFPFHPCGDLGDYDDDGDLDIVLGNFIMRPSSDDAWDSCLTILENRLATD